MSFSNVTHSLVNPLIRLSLAAAIAITVIITTVHAQQGGPADHPAVTVNGQTYTKPFEVLEDKWFKAR